MLRDAGATTMVSDDAAADIGDEPLDVIAGLDGSADDGQEPGAPAQGPAAPPLDAADLELALRYLPDYRVVVIAQALDTAAVAAVVEAGALGRRRARGRNAELGRDTGPAGGRHGPRSAHGGRRGRLRDPGRPIRGGARRGRAAGRGVRRRLQRNRLGGRRRLGQSNSPRGLASASDRGQVDRLEQLRPVVPDVVHEVADRPDPERDLVGRLEQRLELAPDRRCRGSSQRSQASLGHDDRHPIVEVGHLVVRARS